MQIKCTICDKNKRQIKDGKTSHFNENVMYSIYKAVSLVTKRDIIGGLTVDQVVLSKKR